MTHPMMHPYVGMDGILKPRTTHSGDTTIYPGGTGTVARVSEGGTVVLLLQNGEHVEGPLQDLTLKNPVEAAIRLQNRQEDP